VPRTSNVAIAVQNGEEEALARAPALRLATHPADDIGLEHKFAGAGCNAG